MKLGIPLVKGQSSETKAMAEQEQRRPSGEREKEGAPKTKNEGTNLGPQSKLHQGKYILLVSLSVCSRWTVPV